MGEEGGVLARGGDQEQKDRPLILPPLFYCFYCFYTMRSLNNPHNFLCNISLHTMLHKTLRIQKNVAFRAPATDTPPRAQGETFCLS